MTKSISNLAIGELANGIKTTKYKLCCLSLTSPFGSSYQASINNYVGGLEVSYTYTDIPLTTIIRNISEDVGFLENIYDPDLETISLRIYSPQIDGHIVSTRTLGN